VLSTDVGAMFTSRLGKHVGTCSLRYTSFECRMRTGATGLVYILLLIFDDFVTYMSLKSFNAASSCRAVCIMRAICIGNYNPYH
jgi:hypothetical protein